MRRALTGIQPSGQIHLGNYLGAIKPALGLQRDHRAYYFIADLHALTTMKDADGLRQATREIAATFVALGLDVQTQCLFRQSDLPEVATLAWVLACQIPTGMLDRGHAVKAARDGGREPNAGTLFYPVLMAADILLYDANVVPVGKDQKQHVEMARDMAIKVNHHYGEGTLVVPEVAIKEDVGLVPGLDGRKMSKSYDNSIPLWLAPKALKKVIGRIVTDSKQLEDPKDPDTCNVFALYQLFATPEQQADVAGRYRAGGYGYGHAKAALLEAIDAELAEPRERYEALMADPARLDGILEEGADRARATAKATLDRVAAAVGLR